LYLEALEARDCPAGNLAYLGLTANILPSHWVQVGGNLTGPNSAGVQICLTGAVTASVSTDANGNFSYSTQNAVLGTVTGVGTYPGGGTTNPAYATVGKAPPNVSLAISYGSQRTVTLSGYVSDIDKAALTITFSGVVSGSVHTNSDGSFSFTTQASGLGGVQAATVDLWGQQSNTASVNVTSNPPVISNFQASEGTNNIWTFTGTVTDESPAGLTVTLGGLTSLQGKSGTVDATGHFSISVQLKSGDNGLATAVTTDWWGLTSNTAQIDMQQTP
jgi:hypothetical protein